MKIASHFEMSRKRDMLASRIRAGEEIATWSVQDSNHSDDIYNGTYNQCLAEAKRMRRNGDDVVCIALMQLSDDLSATYCIEEVSI